MNKVRVEEVKDPEADAMRGMLPIEKLLLALITVLAIVLAAYFAYGYGRQEMRSTFQREAVAAGIARWDHDENGNPVFVYRTCTAPMGGDEMIREVKLCNFCVQHIPTEKEGRALLYNKNWKPDGLNGPRIVGRKFDCSVDGDVHICNACIKGLQQELGVMK